MNAIHKYPSTAYILTTDGLKNYIFKQSFNESSILIHEGTIIPGEDKRGYIKKSNYNKTIITIIDSNTIVTDNPGRFWNDAIDHHSYLLHNLIDIVCPKIVSKCFIPESYMVIVGFSRYRSVGSNFTFVVILMNDFIPRNIIVSDIPCLLTQDEIDSGNHVFSLMDGITNTYYLAINQTNTVYLIEVNLFTFVSKSYILNTEDGGVLRGIYSKDGPYLTLAYLTEGKGFRRHGFKYSNGTFNFYRSNASNSKLNYITGHTESPFFGLQFDNETYCINYNTIFYNDCYKYSNIPSNHNVLYVYARGGEQVPNPTIPKPKYTLVKILVPIFGVLIILGIILTAMIIYKKRYQNNINNKLQDNHNSIELENTNK